jgi:adenylate cyclase
VRVKKNSNPTKVADIFCYENGLTNEVKEELTVLLKKCIKEYKLQQEKQQIPQD